MSPEPPSYLRLGGVNKPSVISTNPKAEVAESIIITPTAVQSAPTQAVQGQSTSPMQQAMMMSYMGMGAFGAKKQKHGGKNMKKKNDEKHESKIWDTGFGEAYKELKDKKKQKLFVSMDDLLKV